MRHKTIISWPGGGMQWQGDTLIIRDGGVIVREIHSRAYRARARHARMCKGKHNQRRPR